MTIRDIGVDPITNNFWAYNNMKMIKFDSLRGFKHSELRNIFIVIIV